jgi:hypothetical protein
MAAKAKYLGIRSAPEWKRETRAAVLPLRPRDIHWRMVSHVALRALESVHPVTMVRP